MGKTFLQFRLCYYRFGCGVRARKARPREREERGEREGRKGEGEEGECVWEGGGVQRGRPG